MPCPGFILACGGVCRCFAALKQWQKARNAFVQCITTPSQHNAFSKVFIEAFKKLQLVSIILKGEAVTSKKCVSLGRSVALSLPHPLAAWLGRTLAPWKRVLTCLDVAPRSCACLVWGRLPKYVDDRVLHQLKTRAAL